MRLSEFKINSDFRMSDRFYKCTVICTRVVSAIRIDDHVVVIVINEDDMVACDPNVTCDLRLHGKEKHEEKE